MPRAYTQAQLDEAAAATDALPAGSILRDFLADYRDLRREARDCWKR